ncbi:unnamed protein product [Euphydryas editha]|uniref:Uncharacterized protein n=1 Tax=Euphydryas editha TaxID=104508 RepID=A0AAU9VB88_EUPED|nr:unnamed protein product [Euphydryas editha]
MVLKVFTDNIREEARVEFVAADVDVLRLEGQEFGTEKLAVTGEVVVMEAGAGAAETAAGSRRTASRRTRTQAAAGTACRRPPRGLFNVSHDRIHRRPSGFRRLQAPPTPRYRI